MNVLILNGALKGKDFTDAVAAYMIEYLLHEGYTVEIIHLHQHQLAKCTGCFGCWVKTPGICVIDDYGRTIAEKTMKADTVIWLTPVVFGGYSSELKKALDRIIPLVLPFFEKIEGEVHHKARYEKFPRIIVIGTMLEKDIEQQEIFEELIRRNSLNLHNRVSGFVLDTDTTLKEQIIKRLTLNEVVSW